MSRTYAPTLQQLRQRCDDITAIGGTNDPTLCKDERWPAGTFSYINPLALAITALTLLSRRRRGRSRRRGNA
jgi:hypothetical protein